LVKLRASFDSPASALLLKAAAIVLVLGPIAAAENWPRFRGPNGAGISSETGFPVTWSENDWAWKVELPGLGHSSPCVWQDHVFLTSAEREGRVRLVLDFGASTGKLRWTRRLTGHTYKKNRSNSYASSTPATDGERVYVTFASPEDYLVVAYDFAGNELWRRDLGPFVAQHGYGTSPIVYEDLVIVANDQDGPSSVVALDKRSGQIRWQTPREVVKAAYSTPMILHRPGRKPQVVLTSWAEGIAGYDVATGKLAWRSKAFVARAVNSPISGAGLVFATCGGGGRGVLLAAVKPQDGNTDIKPAWIRKKLLPYVPSLLYKDGLLFLWCDRGVVCCVAAATGKELWRQRVGGSFYCSPIWLEGRLYCVSRSGEVIVLAAARQFKELGRFELGEGCHATPAVSNGRIFFRGFRHLFSLAPGARAKSKLTGGGGRPRAHGQ